MEADLILEKLASIAKHEGPTSDAAEVLRITFQACEDPVRHTRGGLAARRCLRQLEIHTQGDSKECKYLHSLLKIALLYPQAKTIQVCLWSYYNRCSILTKESEIGVQAENWLKPNVI